MQIFEAGLNGLKYEDKIKLFNSTHFLIKNFIEEWTHELKHHHGNNAYIPKLIDRLQNEYQKFDALWVETALCFLNEALQKVDDFIVKQGLDDRIVIRHIEDNEFVLQVYELHYLSRSCSLVPMSNIVTGQFTLQIIGNREQKESYRDINKALAQYLNIDYKYGVYLNIEVDSSELAERLIELIGKAD